MKRHSLITCDNAHKAWVNKFMAEKAPISKVGVCDPVTLEKGPEFVVSDYEIKKCAQTISGNQKAHCKAHTPFAGGCTFNTAGGHQNMINATYALALERILGKE